MNDAIVDVQDLRKTYSSLSLSGRKRIEAVRGVSLQAFAGEVFGLLGPNGAGKTTLIKMLLGVVSPSAGKASLFGQPIGSSAARSRVGYLPESLRVDRHHTARSALRYYGSMSRMTSSAIRKRSDELLELVGLAGRDRESVRRFSKGMYQRLGLAQALMHDPDLLVLDEPTDGLDPVGRNEVRRVIERLRDDGKTIFLNSHILQEVELVCTRVAILAEGKLKAIGTLDELSHEGGAKSVEVRIACSELGAEDNVEWNSVFEGQHQATVRIDRLPTGHRIMAQVEGQDQVDWIVDRLRSSNLSITQLSFGNESLEETFIRLVSRDSTDGEESVADTSETEEE